MARIAGVDLAPQKRLWVGLTSIYGIGLPRAKALCAEAKVEQTKKIKDLTEEEVTRLRQAIETEGRVEGDLRKEIADEHPAADRDAVLPRFAPPPQPAGSRPADAHQCPHLRKGPRKGGCRGQAKKVAARK